MIKTIFAVFIAVFALSSSASAQCVRGSEKGLKVFWVGFKTPAKVGVKGYLRGLNSKGPKQADSWQELVLAQTLTLAGSAESVDTKDKVRDAKIAKFFFGQLKGKLTAKVTKIDEKKNMLTLSVTMNGKTVKNIAMKFTRENDTLSAGGHIDVLDFSGSKAIASLNEACASKHQGKTWNHVEIGFKANFKACK